MSEINDLMDELLDYEMDVDDDDADEELDFEISQLNVEKKSNVVENELTLSMDVKEDPSSNEEKQESDKPTSSLVLSEKLEQVQLFPLPLDVKKGDSLNEEEQKSDKSTSSLVSSEVSSSTSLFPLNLHDSKEFWKNTYATIAIVMNKDNIVPTVATELAQAEKVEDSSSIYGETRALNEFFKIADHVSSLNINESKNDLNDIEIDLVDSIVNDQKHPQNLNKQKSPAHENQITNVNNQMPPQYKNLITTCIPMKINKQKQLQYDSQNATTHSSGKNSKKTAGRRYRNTKRETSTNCQALGKDMEPKRDPNYETVFHMKRNIPSLLSIKVLPPIKSDGQTRPVINNSNNLTTTASPFIITALNGAQSSRKVLINPSFKGFATKLNPSDVNIVPITNRVQSMDVRASMKRNLIDEDLRNKMRKKHRPINYEANHLEVIQAHDSANGLKGDNQSDELIQYGMEIEKQKLMREEFQRKKELRLQEVGVDAYNEDLCRI